MHLLILTALFSLPRSSSNLLITIFIQTHAHHLLHLSCCPSRWPLSFLLHHHVLVAFSGISRCYYCKWWSRRKICDRSLLVICDRLLGAALGKRSIRHVDVCNRVQTCIPRWSRLILDQRLFSRLKLIMDLFLLIAYATSTSNRLLTRHHDSCRSIIAWLDEFSWCRCRYFASHEFLHSFDLTLMLHRLILTFSNIILYLCCCWLSRYLQHGSRATIAAVVQHVMLRLQVLMLYGYR